MKHMKMSILAFAVAAAILAGGFATSATPTNAEGPVVAFILENIIECS